MQVLRGLASGFAASGLPPLPPVVWLWVGSRFERGLRFSAMV